MDNLKKSTTVQLLKEEILTILKRKSFYIMCLILIISIFSQTYLGLNRPITLENGFNSYEVVSLFSIFIVMRLSTNKKRVKIQESSKNIQYFFTEIISMYIVIVFVDMVFIVSKVLINLIQVGFGFINYKVFLLAIILNLIFILAVVITLTTIMLIIENNIMAVLLFLFIIKCGEIISFLGNLVGVSVDIRWISLNSYINGMYLNKTLTLEVITVDILYIIVFLVIGIYALKNYNSKIARIKLIGHKHKLIANIKFLIETATYVHNEIFLKYKENEQEKEIVLNELKEIVKTLNEILEKYKNKEIKKLELNKKYEMCIKKYRKMNKEYPWVATFGLYEGYGFSYYKYFKLRI